MEPLGYELSTEEKIYLGNLTNHPGYTVLKKLVDEFCMMRNSRVIKLKRDTPDYIRLLEVYQTEAFLSFEICTTLLKSIEMHAIAGKAEDQLNKIREAATKVVSEVPQLGPQFGSLKIKSPKSDEQSNQE
jgi:hypothetical protein